MENLRYFLSEQNTSAPVYFGLWFHNRVKQGYYSGGAGYVLGQEAVRRWGRDGPNHSTCSLGNRRDGNPEDVILGECMESLGVKTASTLDSLGRTRFHCFGPTELLMGKLPGWFVNTHDIFKGTKKV